MAATKNKKSLIIVESPTKAKTIGGFLGRRFKVVSSYGHMRDLPKSKFGIEIKEESENTVFSPQYIIPMKARKNVTALKKEVARVGKVILATDEDREGEAIAWHLKHIISSLKDLKKPIAVPETERIVFHEITKAAIEKALQSPRQIDEHLVNAQQARRLLDRIVGYKLSPFLWRKVARGLSAGRVQSVALRIICERENEIKAFNSQDYYSISAVFENTKGDKFTSELYKINGKILEQLAIKEKKSAEEIVAEIKKLNFKVNSVQKKETSRHASPPFTTSTLAQESFRRLHFPARTTMAIAQHLYEGVSLGKQRVGLITYMRTDSTSLNVDSITNARDYIKQNFGQDFIPLKPIFYKTKSKMAQEAHEAIRPTDVNNNPQSIKEFLTPQEFKLYDLIFRRFIACQMNNAVFDETIVDAFGEKKDKNYNFKTRGVIIKFPGFQKVWPSKVDEIQVPELNKDDRLKLEDAKIEEHQTQPPSRYSDASLIKILEEYGIGRPSTYSPTISTLVSRGYIIRNKNKAFEATELGSVVNELISNHFPKIVDYEFTSEMEGELDEIAENKRDWQMVLSNFYKPFSKLVEQKEQEIQKTDVNHQETDEVCEKCGKKMISKLGRFGRYLACSGFPECHNTKSLKDPPKKTGIICPLCKKGELLERVNRRGQKFFGCSEYPRCDYTASKIEQVNLA